MSNRGSTLCLLSPLSLLVSQLAKGCKGKCQNFASTKRKPPDEVDRISSLPDDIICHILSFLPTKEAVNTSVLSTRWRSLWTYVTTLDFKDNWPFFPKTSFVHFVGKVLAQRKANSIKRLCLSSYGKDCNSDFLSTLIGTAITQNLEELELFFFYHLEASLPSKLFTCQTISVLKLGWTMNLKITSSIHLPSLKTLHLCLLYIADGKSIMRLLSGCPILEELCYEEVKFNDASSFRICVPSLKKLHIKNHDKRLLIETPSLEHLQLQETKINSDSLVGNLPNLVQAHVDIYFHQQEVKKMPKFFNGISQTKYLCLSTYTIEVLTRAGLEFPEFPNLVHLKLYLSSLNSYFLIQLLLAKCPKLEVLEIEKVCADIKRQWTQPITPVPNCLWSHLTEFKFREYGGSQEDLELTRYILKNGKVLKTMIIQMAKRLEASKIRSSVSKLCTLPRASKDCVTNYQVPNRRLPRPDILSYLSKLMRRNDHYTVGV